MIVHFRKGAQRGLAMDTSPKNVLVLLTTNIGYPQEGLNGGHALPLYNCDRLTESQMVMRWMLSNYM